MQSDCNLYTSLQNIVKINGILTFNTLLFDFYLLCMRWSIVIHSLALKLGPIYPLNHLKTKYLTFFCEICALFTCRMQKNIYFTWPPTHITRSPRLFVRPPILIHMGTSACYRIETGSVLTLLTGCESDGFPKHWVEWKEVVGSRHSHLDQQCLELVPIHHHLVQKLN